MIIKTDTKCRLYSAVVTRNWHESKAPTPASELTGFVCFSSWVKRSDIISTTELAAPPELGPDYVLIRANDGYHCLANSEFLYHSARANPTFFQVDLKGYYTLKCVKMTTRRNNSFFKFVEFRFGNESKAGNYQQNPIIGYVGDDNGVLYEFCPVRPLVGRYLGLRQYYSTFILVGEIQVTIL